MDARLPILEHPEPGDEPGQAPSPILLDAARTSVLRSLDPAGTSPLPGCLAALSTVLSRYEPRSETRIEVRTSGGSPQSGDGGDAATVSIPVDADEALSLRELARRCGERLSRSDEPGADSSTRDATGVPTSKNDGAASVVVEYDTLAGTPDPRQLVIRIAPTCEGLWIDVEYGRGPAAPTRARWIGGHLHTLLERGLERPDVPTSGLGMVSDAERRVLLGEFSGSATDYPGDAAVPRLFGEIVDRFADAVALDDGISTTTYRDLDAAANRLAHHLRRRGVGQGDSVGLLLERTPRLVTAVLAVSKLGAVYVPLDPSHPAERMALLLTDTGSRIVLTVSALVDLLPADLCRSGTMEARDEDAERSIGTLVLDGLGDALDGEPANPPDVDVDASAPLYVMYTSGSTGTPKGVVVPHRAVVRLVRNTNYVSLDADECVLCYAPLSFDASTFEIWGALLNGARLAVVPPELPSLDQLGRFIEGRGVTTLWLTAPLFHRMVDGQLHRLGGVRQVLAGGDVLSPRHVAKTLEEHPGIRVINGYGPTENTTFTCCNVVTSPDDVTDTVPIGRPVSNTRVYVVDEHLDPVGVGVPGELLTGGDGLALGYLGRPELTDERFVIDPFSTELDARLYRTGDRVRFLADGRIEFLGRLDNQVKIRGFRVEPEEVEVTLARHEGVGQCAVITAVRRGEKILVAYASPAPGFDLVSADLRRFLRESVPEYMVPSAIVILDRLPVTRNGKVDRSALPDFREELGEEAAPASPPSTEWEVRLAEVWQSLLDVESVGIQDGFFDVGGNSLLALQMVEDLRERYGVSLTVAGIFQYPTIRSLAAHLSGDGGERTAAAREHARIQKRREVAGAAAGAEGIAVVGMAGRFPGASSVEELWEVLCSGRETTMFFLETPEGLDPSIPSEIRDRPDYVAARGILEGADRLDAALLGISPRLAQVTDPQHRVFLEIAWEALESAGYPPGAIEQVVGIYAGMGYNNYFPRNVAPHRDLVHSLGELRVQLANEKDYVAIATAHKLDLKGPAVSVHTACSTSLTAVAHACQSLMLGQCDMALAGGVAVTVPQRNGHIYQEGGMLSADGHCRPFDARATGTVFSDGAAAVVLKRLPDAERDGDTVYAVIRGVGINNDGAKKASFTAPTVDGQAAAISMALAQAGWDADSVGLVEAHGTATPLGDPVEVEALTQAFRVTTDRSGFCALGSLKSNVGHLTAAAGVTGLIKAVLSVNRGVIPGTLFFETPNPAIDFTDNPFFVNSETVPWPDGPGPRRAGVSSFGVGGTNVHVVLEEYTDPRTAAADAGPQLLLLSARTPTALDAATRRLRDHLSETPEARLPDVAYTLQVGRRRFKHRRFVVADDATEAAERLDRLPASHAGDAEATDRVEGPVFVFPGQGVQYPGMCRDLYERDGDFRADLDRCASILHASAGMDLLSLMFSEGDADEAAAALAQTSVTQPALFSVGYALARLWMRWGVEPSAMVGHSLGEITAACVASVLTLEDALELVAARGSLIQALPTGAMLSVQAPADWVSERLPDGVSLAGDNAPGLVAVSGPTELIHDLEAAWSEQGIRCRTLKTSHAFHSSMMDAALEPFREVVERLSLFPPEIPIMSSVTGAWLTADQATDPEYWVRHIRSTVRFGPAVSSLSEAGHDLFLEVGPRSSGSALVRQSIGSSGTAVPSIETGPKDRSEWEALVRAAGRLWVQGCELDWRAVHAGAEVRRVALPTYPFEGARYWIEPPDAAEAPMPAKREAAPLAGAAVSASPRPGAAESLTPQEDLVRRQLDVIRAQLGIMAGPLRARPAENGRTPQPNGNLHTSSGT